MKFPDSDFKQQTLSPPRPKPLTGLGATLKSRAPARSNWPNVRVESHSNSLSSLNSKSRTEGETRQDQTEEAWKESSSGALHFFREKSLIDVST